MRGLTLRDPAFLHQAAAPSRLPASLSGHVEFWHPMDVTSGITASGGLVSAVADASGNGNTLVQATGAKQPTTGAHTINGLNVLTLDGSRVLQCTSLTAAVNELTVFCIFQATAAAGTIWNVAGSSCALWAPDSWTDGSGRMPCIFIDDQGSVGQPRTAELAGTALHLLAGGVTISGLLAKTSLDNSAPGVFTTITSGHTFTPTKFFLGGQSNGSPSYAGHVCEIIGINTYAEVGSTIYNDVHTYAQSWWGAP